MLIFQKLLFSIKLTVFHSTKGVLEVSMLFFSPTIFCTVILVIFSGPVLGWGRNGHGLIAEIAHSLLTPNATSFVLQTLPAEVNGNMSAVSIWADNILYADTEPNYLNWQWSAPLHYVNTKDWSCVYDRQSDCSWNSTQGCVDGAIQNYTKRLANPELDSVQKEEALKFIIHFIGDVHQPLHGGFASDLGGNTIRGRYFNILFRYISIRRYIIEENKNFCRRIFRSIRELSYPLGHHNDNTQNQSRLSIATLFIPSVFNWTNERSIRSIHFQLDRMLYGG